MKTSFVRREITEIPNNSIILLNNKRCKVRNLAFSEFGAHFLALPETFVHGDANVIGKKVECSIEAVYLVEEEQSNILLVLSCLICFSAGTLAAGIIAFVKFHAG